MADIKAILYLAKCRHRHTRPCPCPCLAQSRPRPPSAVRKKEKAERKQQKLLKNRSTSFCLCFGSPARSISLDRTCLSQFPVPVSPGWVSVCVLSSSASSPAPSPPLLLLLLLLDGAALDLAVAVVFPLFALRSLSV